MLWRLIIYIVVLFGLNVDIHVVAPGEKSQQTFDLDLSHKFYFEAMATESYARALCVEWRVDHEAASLSAGFPTIIVGLGEDLHVSK